MEGITKRYGDLIASNAVDLELHAGEVHALLGENGAGKSTLMKILSGTTPADSGHIVLEGHGQAHIRSPRDALAYRIGMVHQDYRLVRNFTVAENLFLGSDSIPRRAARSELVRTARAAVAEWNWDVKVDAKVADLSIGEQQRVAILRSLIRGARVLILDEPTAVLTPADSRDLFAKLRELARDGVAVVFISHKLAEVLQVSDRITVLRAGQVVGRMRADQATESDLVRLMVGHDVARAEAARGRQQGGTLLRAAGLRALDPRGRLVLKDVDLDIHQGEILGIAGVSGNGQRELSEVLAGMRATVAGAITLAGKELRPGRTREFIAAGVRHVPEDRATTGLVLDESISRNAIMRGYLTSELTRHGLLRSRRITHYVKSLIKHASLDGKSGAQSARHLSGGNRQRLIAGRELHDGAEVLIAVHPTQGIDVQAAQAIHRELLRTRDAGKGILLISEDLDEVLTLSDRVVVIYEGTLRGEFYPDQPGAREAIGWLMAGASEPHGPTPLEAQTTRD